MNPLPRWARLTWAGLAAMEFVDTGLPADGIADTLAAESRTRATSPTNIGGLLWCTVAARELGLIDAREATLRLVRTLAGLADLERHGPTGLFYNWYDPADGALLRTFPGGGPISPFLSSVDNGWLVAGLLVAAAGEPAVAGAARELLAEIDLGFFHDPDAVADTPGGLLRGGGWTENPSTGSVLGPHGVHFTAHHYGQLNSEPRITSYLGIALGQIPAEHLQCLGRYELIGDNGRPVGDPVGVRAGVGADGTVAAPTGRLVPTFGGSMFEALMPALFIPEAVWSPHAWALNHPATVAAQRDFGLQAAHFGSWGFSPASDPDGGYSEWGVASLGVLGIGYPCDRERTSPYQADEKGWGDGVVTPHALFLALPVAPEPAIDALTRLERAHGLVGPGGFDDAVAVHSGRRSHRYLCLDQAMVLAGICAQLAGPVLSSASSAGPIAGVLRELLTPFRFATTRGGSA